MKRYGAVIRLRPDFAASYKEYHRAVWPEVLDMIRACHIRNYTIFLRDNCLYAYYEYHGSDHAADMARMAADPKTQEWWGVMKPMQEPVETVESGQWWAPMEEVFHAD